MSKNENEEKIESQLEFWKPEHKGQELSGEYVDTFAGNFGEQVVILALDDKKYVTPSHGFLVNLLRECVIGDQLRIVYDGDGKAKKGQTAPKLYSVYRTK